MTDEELSSYIPKHGDRLRLKRFLTRSQKEEKQNHKRENLLSILRKKIEDKRHRKPKTDSSAEEESEEMRPRQLGNRNAQKQTRKIELGWIHLGVQVRLRKGGGTRKINIKKDATKKDMIKEGIQLFFPHGESPKGPVSEFVCDVKDFSSRSISEDKTVREMYNETKIPLLRFYFTTEKIESKTDSKKDESRGSEEIPGQSNHGEISDDDDELPDLHVTLRSKRKARNDETDEGSDSGKKQHDILQQAINLAGIIDDSDEMTVSNIGNTNALEATNEILPPPSPIEHKITLHRGQVLKEMIREFKKIDPFSDIVTMTVLLPNGVPETAEDGGGVTRDVLCEFWNSFFEECTLGSSFKVPCLRHDFGELEWQSVGKIIVFGWGNVGYFPIQLSIAFLEQCLFNTVKSNLLQEFLKFIPESDAVCLKSALNDIGSVDMDEFLEILDQHEIKRVPRQDTIEKILEEIAHKELVQSSMFVIDCIAPFLKKLSISEEELKTMFESLCPTTRKVSALLKFPEVMSPEEIVVSNHLRRFVRELDIATLKKFMRFCTGSDLLLQDHIDVSFVNVTGIARRPVAHTCSCLLEIPKTCESFPGFRTEYLAT